MRGATVRRLSSEPLAQIDNVGVLHPAALQASVNIAHGWLPGGSIKFLKLERTGGAATHPLPARAKPRSCDGSHFTDIGHAAWC